MKSDNTIRNGTSIFVGIIVAIAAFVHGALLLPLLLVACSVWGLYVLHHLRGSLPEIPKKKEKAPRRAKFVVPDIEDERGDGYNDAHEDACAIPDGIVRFHCRLPSFHKNKKGCIRCPF